MALGIHPILERKAQMRITNMGVPTDFAQENRVSHCAKNTAKHKAAGINKREVDEAMGKCKKNREKKAYSPKDSLFISRDLSDFIQQFGKLLSQGRPCILLHGFLRLSGTCRNKKRSKLCLNFDFMLVG